MHVRISYLLEENVIECSREFIILAFSPSFFLPEIIVESGEQL
jgi:hypothetical protein